MTAQNVSTGFGDDHHEQHSDRSAAPEVGAHGGAAGAGTAYLPSSIVIAATPLGNSGDASQRLKDALGVADIIAAEDTRRTRALARSLGVEISGTVVSNFDHNESAKAKDLVEKAQRGAMVVVVTDAGMPSVSDPGFPLVRLAHELDVRVTCLPGPSAVTTALALSGLGVGTFCFDGFAPRKDGARRQWLATLKTEKRACCFFESPHRIGSTLAVAAEVLGEDRQAAVCRELTKTFEEVKRDSLGALAQWASQGLRGEITVVIEGASDSGAHPPIDELVAEIESRVEQGQRLKEACGEVATQWELSKRDLYEAVQAARKA